MSKFPSLYEVNVAQTGGSFVLGLRPEFVDLACLQRCCIGNVDRSDFISAGSVIKVGSSPAPYVNILVQDQTNFK